MAIKINSKIKAYLEKNKKDTIEFRAGDTLKVVYREDDKDKGQPLQTFEGVCISKKGGSQAGATFTLRKDSSNIGVEKTFPLFSSRLEKIEVTRKGKVRRAKLFYLRGLSKRAARIRERR
tara:strand:+ start:929 stop:1288 length:360 start_codon:yes stop_codon:yes gene_type:complete